MYAAVIYSASLSAGNGGTTLVNYIANKDLSKCSNHLL